MAGSGTNDNEDKDDVLLKNSGLSTSFTITFEDDDDSSISIQKKIIKSSNLFVKRHVRTLSLPFSNDYQFIKGEATKNNEDNTGKNINDENGLNSSGYAKLVKKTMNGTAAVNNKKDFNDQNKRIELIETDLYAVDNKFIEIISDTESEGGTYTLDKNNKQVQIARKSIDQVFGISSNGQNIEDNLSADEKFQNKNRMIDEWMEHSVTAIKSTTETSKSHNVTANCYLKNKPYISKIPSPIVSRRELNLALDPIENKKSSTEIKPNKQPNLTNTAEGDTKCFLKETENIVTALQNRLHSDLKKNITSVLKKQINEQEKESSINKYANTRFNRAFSLRRDRMKKSSSVINSTAIPVRTKKLTSFNSLKSALLNENDRYLRADDKNIISKDVFKNKKTSSVMTTAVSSPKIGRQFGKNDDNLKKKISERLKSNVSGTRSNSSLSVQEIEFQNWKRRKSYDPLKAAAEDKKKKSIIHSVVGSSSVSASNKKPKSQENNSNKGEKGIMRSASFHGLRNKNGLDKIMYSDKSSIMNRSTSSRYISSYSNENSISSDIPDDDEEDEWIIPNPPSSSLQNTPPESVSSRLSLLSNAASCSALQTSSSVTKVNFTTLLNVTQLSQTIKTTISSLTDSLKANYDNCIQNTQSCQQNENDLTKFPVNNKNVLNEFNNDFVQNNDLYYVEKNLDEDEDKSIQEHENSGSKYNEFMVDHQLRITLDNLRQIHVAVQELQLVCSNK